MKNDELIDKINYIQYIAWHGCFNHYCRFNSVKGDMKTNMICKDIIKNIRG